MKSAAPATQLSLDFSAPPLSVPPAGAPMRSLVSLGQTIDYQLKRSKRRTIGFRIDERGLIVTAPHRTSLSDIERSIHHKARWIIDKTTQWQDKRPASFPPFIWGHGARFSYLGQDIVLCLDAEQMHFTQDTLALPLPSTTAPERIRRAVRAWLDAQALRLYQTRIDHYAPILGVAVQRLRLSSARTRWGSCNARGHIGLHRQLIQLPLEWIDYVVVHELAHLHEMNHSPRFWKWVALALPNYRVSQAALRASGHLIQMP